MQPSIQLPQSQQSTSSGTFVQRCLLQYQDKLKQENDFEYQEPQQDLPQQLTAEEQNLKYYGYEDKKSITIKPIRMHKDLIALRRQNEEKKRVIGQLQQQNLLLKNKYQHEMASNHKVQKFLKDIEFTFKNDKKAQKANEIMLKAKRMLYREAIQCQNNAKKITKGPQANTVQEIKMYIEVLQQEKERLQKIISNKKQENEQLMEEEDFNAQNEEKFELTLDRVEKMLEVELLRTKRHNEVYKIEKGMVSTGLKEKEIMLNKKEIEKYYEKLKDLMLKKEGEEYEIQVLQKKRKDKIKLIEEMKQFKSDIIFKKSSIQQLEKELKEKLKTYDYMSKWSRELKSKLQEKKENHISNKISYEKKINALSRQFEEWNKKYKLELVQQQFIGNNTTINNLTSTGNVNQRKKNTSTTAKQLLFAYGNSRDGSTQASLPVKKMKLIRIQEIKTIVKRIKIWLLQNEIDLELFIKEGLLKWDQGNKEDVNTLSTNVKNVQFNSTLQGNSSSNKMRLLQPRDKNIIVNMFNSKRTTPQSSNTVEQPKQTTSSQDQKTLISLRQLYENIRAQILILQDYPDVEVMKLARYVVEDAHEVQKSSNLTSIKLSDGSIVINSSINKRIAFVIIKKLFQCEIQSLEQLEQIKLKFKEFLTKNYDPFRYDVLKMLLHMGGLKGVIINDLQQPNQQVQNAQHENNDHKFNNLLWNSNQNSIPLNLTQNSYELEKICPQQQKATCMQGNMKRNQQLHLQLQLDQSIFMKKLQKHVVEEYYVARYKELIDFMIFQEFNEVDRPRLGMFDRVCQIVTGKKLIKENITRNYNFNLLLRNDEIQPSVSKKNKIEQNSSTNLKEFKQSQFSPSSFDFPLAETKSLSHSLQRPQDSEQNYWIVPQTKPSAVNIELQDDDEENSKRLYQGRKISKTAGPQKGSPKRNSWLDDLMSDGQEHQHQQKDSSDFSNEDF